MTYDRNSKGFWDRVMKISAWRFRSRDTQSRLVNRVERMYLYILRPIDYSGHIKPAVVSQSVKIIRV